MRLFLAVSPDEPARARLDRLLDEIRRNLSRWERSVRWVRSEHLHLTVHFLGETPADRIPRLTAALGSSLALAPFDLELDGAGVFARRRMVRTLWLSVGRGRDAMGRLHDEVTSRLCAAGWRDERRPFEAHLTIGRVRDGMSGRTAGLAEALAACQVPAVHWRVRSLILYVSDLSGPHPVHTPVHTVELSGAA